jgi:hypothetical protein
MSDITTTITITLTHDCTLTEAEFKNLTGNIFEHIENERFEELKSPPATPWGFASIERIEGEASHSELAGVRPHRRWAWTLVTASEPAV